MKQKINLQIKKGLSTAIVLFSLFLVSCGGGGGDSVAANGGISGTGITMGRITNFGSIFVNGVRFDVNNATFIRDGSTATLGQADFSVGEFVVLKSTIDAGGTTGTASEVSFTDLLEGRVTSASTDAVTIEVLGQTISTDNLTVFIGFNTLTTLSIGNIVEVSGIKDANGFITATSIRLKATSFQVGTSENEIKGTITSVNSTLETFTIGGITIDYSNADLQGFNGQPPQVGQFVEAKSNQAITGITLLASRIELEDEYQNLEANTEAEIEGLVTSFNSATSFAVNGLAVTTTNATQYENGTVGDIAPNALMEVSGRVNAAGLLVAEEISFENPSEELEIKGLLQSINISANELVLDGLAIVLTSSTLMIDESDQNVSPLTLSDLSVGDTLEVYGIAQTDGKILATKLERSQPDDD